nr:alpha/beta hydrolase [Stenotrophomonas maltophilia]
MILLISPLRFLRIITAPCQPYRSCHSTQRGQQPVRTAMKAVQFPNGNITMAGQLHVPEHAALSARHPAIVVVHPAGGVKEQTATVHAASLVKQGFVVLTFDASCQGNSTGAPRGNENPYARVADISAAIDLLVTLPIVDADRIGVLGICAGGGYAAHATMNDRRIRAVGTISAVNYGQMFRQGWDGDADPRNSVALLDAAAQARTRQAEGGQLQYQDALPANREAATHPDFAEAFDYYRTPRGQHPNATGLFPLQNLAELVGYDAFNNAELFLTQPLLAIAGSEAGTRWMSEELHRRAASTDKHLLILAGGTHVALYDQPEFVARTGAALGEFYHQALVAR